MRVLRIGDLTLNGTNSCTGTTDVNVGMPVVNGAQPASPVRVMTNAAVPMAEPTGFFRVKGGR